MTILRKEERSIYHFGLNFKLRSAAERHKTGNQNQPNPQSGLLACLRHHLMLPARLGHTILVALLQRDLQLHTRPVHLIQVHMLWMFNIAKALRIMNLRLRSKVLSSSLLSHLKQRSFHVVQVNKARDHAVHRCHVEASRHVSATRLALN